MEKHLCYKVAIEKLGTNSCAYFFVNGIDLMLGADYFNTKMKDAKSGKEITIKSSVLEQLEKTEKGERPKEAQQSIEFSRYKQDCRKRALDLAHSQFQNCRYVLTEDKKERTLANPEIDSALISLADKYYNWLISIPGSVSV